MPVIREKRFLRVKLDMVGMCQLKCVMCHFAHPDFVANTTQMGRELLEKVGNDLFPRAHDVVLSSSAEPLLAKELPRALELCREHNVPNFHFSTNGIASCGMFGVATVGFGPGDEIWAHTPDDQVPIAHLEAAARFYALFPQRFRAAAAR